MCQDGRLNESVVPLQISADRLRNEGSAWGDTPEIFHGIFRRKKRPLHDLSYNSLSLFSCGEEARYHAPHLRCYFRA